MLDEPAAGLSHDEAVHVAEVIRRTNADGVSLIVVDHNMRFITRLCHRIVVLHHGAVREIGTHQELVEARGIYYRLYQLQYALPSEASPVGQAATRP